MPGGLPYAHRIDCSPGSVVASVSLPGRGLVIRRGVVVNARQECRSLSQPLAKQDLGGFEKPDAEDVPNEVDGIAPGPAPAAVPAVLRKIDGEPVAPAAARTRPRPIRCTGLGFDRREADDLGGYLNADAPSAMKGLLLDRGSVSKSAVASAVAGAGKERSVVARVTAAEPRDCASVLHAIFLLGAVQFRRAAAW